MDGKIIFLSDPLSIIRSRYRAISKVFFTRIGRNDLLTLGNGPLNVKYEFSVNVSILTEFWTMKVIITSQKGCRLLE